MEEIKDMLANPILTLVGILLILREIHSLVNSIKALIIQRNDIMSSSFQSVLSRLDDIKRGLVGLYQLIKSK